MLSLLSLTAHLMGLLNALLLIMLLADGDRSKRALCAMLLALVALYGEGLLHLWPEATPVPWLLLPQTLMLPSFYLFLRYWLQPQPWLSPWRHGLLVSLPSLMALLYLTDANALPLLLTTLAIQWLIYLRLTLSLLQAQRRRKATIMAVLFAQIWLLWMLHLASPLLPFSQLETQASWLLPLLITIPALAIGVLGLSIKPNRVPPKKRQLTVTEVLDEEELAMLHSLWQNEKQDDSDNHHR
ncbi:hypothetical protein [Ferrimonas senticii]|uniref:hypothetical protein n=1 Tax=Ferrimonas senticii TaxID=394566 RepID=UPI0003FBD7DC|nr:hypothetical protein [Ferrimonas senticii]